ncbi:MAG: hypothetical protein ACRD3J_23550 [Thermoanaerobaculia bacterium]
MRKVVLLVTVILIMSVAIPSANAGTSTLTLKRVSLTNVNDAAGLWQYEAGTVLVGEKLVGAFAATRRFVTGTTPPADMFTLTLFFAGNPPRNVTLMGSWTTNPGGGIGGVSAASQPYQFLQPDGTFTMVPAGVGPSTYKLTINWTGGGSVP